MCIVSLSACSFAIQGPPQGATPARRVECQEGSAAPTVDLVAATSLIAITAFLGAGLSNYPPCEHQCEDDDDSVSIGPLFLGALIGTVIASPWLIASHVGRQRLSRCRELHGAYDELHPPPPPPPLPALPPRPPGPGLGEPCRNPIAEQPNTGTCDRGLFCRGTVCSDKP